MRAAHASAKIGRTSFGRLSSDSECLPCCAWDAKGNWGTTSAHLRIHDGGDGSKQIFIFLARVLDHSRQLHCERQLETVSDLRDEKNKAKESEKIHQT